MPDNSAYPHEAHTKDSDIDRLLGLGLLKLCRIFVFASVVAKTVSMKVVLAVSLSPTTKMVKVQPSGTRSCYAGLGRLAMTMPSKCLLSILAKDSVPVGG